MPIDQPDPLNPLKKLYTYEGEKKPLEIPTKAAVNLKEITVHIEQHIGPTNGAFHEIVSDQVHIDVIMVPPNEKYDAWTLVTSGMSDKPMTSPRAPGKEFFSELLIRLPKTWIVPDFDKKGDWKKEENFWPVRLLKFVARFPHKYNALLWSRHTLDNGQPAKPWSPCAPFKAAFLAPSRTLPAAFEDLKISDGMTIKFTALYPVYLEESALARQAGAEELWKKFVEHRVTDIIDPSRPNLVEGAAPAKKTTFWDRLREK